MAPSAARMPHLMPAPSNAGPAEQAQATIQSALPITISPLVPMSMKRKTSLPVGRQLGTEQARGDVAAHIAAYAGSTGHDGLRMDVQAHLLRAQFGNRVDRGNIRSLPNVARRQAQQQMDHGRVAGQERSTNICCGSTCTVPAICSIRPLIVSSTRLRSSARRSSVRA